MRTILPEDWPRPKGYSNGIAASGELLVLAGQIGWDSNEQLVGEDLCGQIKQALTNVVTLLHAGGAKAEHLVRLVWYTSAIEEYRNRRKEIGRIYRDVIGKHYPVMTLIGVSELFDLGAKIEIEATAVIPGETGQ